ncbi:MAG: hypothetical protein IJR62_06485 [Lachnospiraceae bacterium]|nr:hypothetical protein [Lachnospiraceae bacterium]
MNYFVEGLQGSGKSTLVRKLSDMCPGCTAVREGEYSPVELSWCAYVDEEKYHRILEKYPGLSPRIRENTYPEGDRRIICYTKIVTKDRDFYRDLEQDEIYNGRVPFDVFRSIVLGRFRQWESDRMIFECSLFQNIVEDMILFRQAGDEEILAFYRQVQKALGGKEYRIIYLRAEDVRGNLETIRRERTDEQGNEIWFRMMLGYFNDCPYARARGLKGEEDLIRHFIHRQDLELRLCGEVFPDRSVILESKDHSEEDIRKEVLA